jgi:hypothetical protein
MAVIAMASPIATVPARSWLSGLLFPAIGFLPSVPSYVFHILAALRGLVAAKSAELCYAHLVVSWCPGIVVEVDS